MANERTYPCLPCREIDESISFYESLGFKKTYRQVKPNPYAVVAFEDIQIHLFSIDGFNPADSYGSVIVVVPDPESLYHTFAARLRETYGKLSIVGTPRILRPRKKYGTISGFSLIDTGGNWLRVYKLGDSEHENTSDKVEVLAQIINVAARLGDAHGNEAMALKTLESGLKRFPKAAAIEHVKAYLYRAELAIRINNLELAQSSLALAKSLNLTDGEKATVTDEFTHVALLVNQEQELNK